MFRDRPLLMSDESCVWWLCSRELVALRTSIVFLTVYVAERIGLPYPPPYLAPTTKGPVILKGVNFASAAAGILRSTGYNFVSMEEMHQHTESIYIYLYV
jgi:hypothetical protein